MTDQERIAALEAENERLKEDSYFALYKSAKERVFAVEQERDTLKEQVARLEKEKA